VPSELDVYQPPKADSPALPEPSTAQAKLYTAQQIALATFLGGPIAGCLLLASNHATFGRASARMQTIVWGLVGTAVAIAVALALPQNVPNSIVPVAYTSAVYQFAKTKEGADYQSRLAGAGRQPYWKPVVTGLASLIVIVGLLALYYWLTGDLS
jgi:hypothetical protein